MTDKQTYITKQGLEDIKKEIEELTQVKRHEIAERIAAAKELGDLSENADYSTAKDDQAFNEGRIVELEHLVKNAMIIEEEKQQPGVVTVGSQITIEEQDGSKTRQYHIVGSHEANPTEGRISNESPIGQALLGAGIGDVVEINLPKGIIRCKIVEVN